MRLICPNCDAQYEVPDDVMPPDGRDVQCSNCGTTWFQEHPDAILAAEAVDGNAPQEDEEFVSFDKPAPQSRGAEAAMEEDENEAAEEIAQEAPAPQPAPQPAAAPARRELDPSVADVLRAEAELEEQARRNENASMESQPELGLQEETGDAKKRAREARDRMARMRGETPPSQDPAEADGLGSRRDLLPDIEEINSTLRSNNDRSPATDPGQTAQIEVQEKRSSRRGFVFTVALVSFLAVTYTFAPAIVDALPQLESFMNGYVNMVNSWRMWLDARVSDMLSWLDAAAVSTGQ